MAIGAWLDLLGSLGLISALGFAYARLSRLLHVRRMGQTALGLCFGLVAVFEMHRPFEPFDGLIIDLRNVPIVLTGAFLGGPAALLTLGLALCARFAIGGVGVWAGMIGMVMALAAGRLWARHHRDIEERDAKSLILLGAMLSTNLASALVLPAPMAHWFVTQAALPILAMNMLAVPLLAFILEAERRGLKTEQALRASATRDQVTGLLSVDTLRDECAMRAMALADGSYTHALAIRLRPTHNLSIWNTRAMNRRLLGAMRLRLSDAMPQCDLAGTCGTNVILLPLSQTEMLDLDGTKTAVRRAATEDAYALTGTHGHRVSVDLDIVDLSREIEVEMIARPQVFGTARLRERVKQVCSRRDIAGRSTPKVDPKLEHLFAKAEFLMTGDLPKPSRYG